MRTLTDAFVGPPCSGILIYALAIQSLKSGGIPILDTSFGSKSFSSNELLSSKALCLCDSMKSDRLEAVDYLHTNVS